ncbi:MAG: hypothetical protein ABI832_05390 [bacterium]
MPRICLITTGGTVASLRGVPRDGTEASLGSNPLRAVAPVKGAAVAMDAMMNVAVGDIVASGVPVTVTSRCAEGFVRPIHGNGSGKDLQEAGAIFVGEPSGQTARGLAAVLLGAAKTGKAMRRVFAEVGG